MLKASSIRTQVIVLVLAITIPLMAIQAYTAYSALEHDARRVSRNSLSVARLTAEVWVESAEGDGSTFFVHLEAALT